MVFALRLQQVWALEYELVDLIAKAGSIESALAHPRIQLPPSPPQPTSDDIATGIDHGVERISRRRAVASACAVRLCLRREFRPRKCECRPRKHACNARSEQANACTP